MRTSWPQSVKACRAMCANHLASDCFSHLRQHNAGLAMKLFLKEGSVPTVLGKTADERNLNRVIMLYVLTFSSYINLAKLVKLL